MKLFSLIATLIIATSILLLSSCNKTTGAGQRATVELRDGSNVTGTIVSTSTSEVQLTGDDKVTRTIPMAQVRSIDYLDAVDSSGAATASSSAPNPAPTAAPVRHRDHYHPAESAITSKTYELPVGTQISVRNEETIDSKKASEGQQFAAEVTTNVLDAAGDVVIPAGANAQIVIRSASAGGRIRGASDLVLDLASVSIDGRQYALSTADLQEKGRNGVGANRRTGEFAGGGAAIGAIIGAIAGGGKGAAIGAGSGAGAGALTQILTKGTIKVPVESTLTFKLDQPLRVKAS
jgi:hypothetical protein